MRSSDQLNLAAKYLVDDLPGARQRGSRLYGILEKFDAGLAVSGLARQYLATSGLNCLLALIEGQRSFDTFKNLAAEERKDRVAAAQLAAIEEAAVAERQKAELAAASADFFNDPVYLRRQAAKSLRRRFDVGHIESEQYPKVMRALNALAQGQRLPSEKVAWLQTEAEDCWTPAVAAAWHLIEAEYLSRAYRSTADPWDAINASSHWRKGGRPEAAVALTEDALAAKTHSSAKVRSALFTTRGAALRAVNRHAEARVSGEQAHVLAPEDYRPCTLLGAIHMERGELTEGHAWFVKAEQRGADEAMIDNDIKVLLSRMPEERRLRLQSCLLERDPERFAWLRSRWRPACGSAQAS